MDTFRLIYNFFVLGLFISFWFIILNISIASKDKKGIFYIGLILSLYIYCLNSYGGLLSHFLWSKFLNPETVNKVNLFFLISPAILLGNKQLRFNRNNIKIKKIQKMCTQSQLLYIFSIILCMIFLILPRGVWAVVVKIFAIVFAYGYNLFQFGATYFFYRQDSKFALVLIILADFIIAAKQIVRLLYISYTNKDDSAPNSDWNIPEILAMFLIFYHYFKIHWNDYSDKIQENKNLISKIEEEKIFTEKHKIVYRMLNEYINPTIHILKNQVEENKNLLPVEKAIFSEDIYKIEETVNTINSLNYSEFVTQNLERFEQKINLKSFLDYVMIPEINELSMMNAFPDFRNSVSENIFVKSYPIFLSKIIQLALNAIKKTVVVNSKILIETNVQLNFLNIIIDFSGENIEYDYLDSIINLDFIDSKGKYLKNEKYRELLEKWGGLCFSIKYLVSSIGGTIDVVPFKSRLKTVAKIPITLCDSQNVKDYSFIEVNENALKPKYPETIFVINENHSERLELFTYLKPFYKVFTFNSFVEVYGILENKIPEFIICSEKVQELYASDFLKKIKSEKNWASIPVIVISSTKSESFEKSNLEAGALDVLSLPYSQENLLFKINSILESRRMLLQNFMNKLSKVVQKAESQNEFLGGEIKPKVRVVEKVKKEEKKSLPEENNISVLSAKFDSANLTKTEAKIATLMAQGKSDKEISNELQISVGTVAVHNKKIFKKLNIHSRKELL